MNKLYKSKVSQGGFTLIELLVVIGILAILLAITLIAINPNKHFQDTRNAQRSSNVAAILDAIYEYESSNNGSRPPSVANITTAVPLGAKATEAPTGTTFATPSLTFTGLTNNFVTSGSVTVSSCTSAGNNGTFTVTGGSATTIVVTNAAGVAGDTTCSLGTFTSSICTDLVPTYLAAFPMDPSSTDTQCAATFNSGYTISQSNGRYTVSAPDTEPVPSATPVSVTR